MLGGILNIRTLGKRYIIGFHSIRLSDIVSRNDEMNKKEQVQSFRFLPFLVSSKWHVSEHTFYNPVPLLLRFDSSWRRSSRNLIKETKEILEIKQDVTNARCTTCIYCSKSYVGIEMELPSRLVISLHVSARPLTTTIKPSHQSNFFLIQVPLIHLPCPVRR